MRFSTALTLALTALLVTSSFGVVAAAPPASTDTDDRVSAQFAVGADGSLSDAEPRQVIRISIDGDGNAQWAIESRFLLEDQDDVDAFSAYADAVAAGDRDVEYDLAAFERALADAEAKTDRGMNITNDGWDEPRIERDNGSEVPAEIDAEEVADNESETGVGVVSYSFTWTNFAEVDGSQIHVGDAFQTENGPWFPGLTAGQQLIIESPPNYGFDSFPPVSTTDDGSLVWNGPHEFSENELEIVYLRGANEGPPEPPNDDDGFLSSQVATIGGLGLLVVLVAAVVLLRRTPILDDESESTAAERDDPPEASQPADPIDDEPSASAADSATTVAFEEPDDEVDLDLLSDEERVTRLLRENGGRMKQASIVKETGWSNAKVSQLLSKMDDDGEIEKLRIGRENLITLPDADPTEIE
ncbi:helix-turn-helix transcriptional regulator [Natrononativus amylolyticus]|uniref:helix-turn-helix transcriptional regulator n=1 Tax=Natrononativus amylolyticus TaxID=2963434 RepID=UPI0020CF9035|nr:hypothetical protein [Natrononativus amylolyticus]